MTIIVTQSNAQHFPGLSGGSGAQLPGVYEAWPITPIWTVDVSFAAEIIEVDPISGLETTTTTPVTDISVVSNPNNLFEYADVNYTKISNNTLRVYGPAVNVFRDAYYQFQLEHTDAIFSTVNGQTIELDPIVLPNQNDPNVTISDEDFVMPPRPKGEVEIVDTGPVYPTDAGGGGGVIAVSLPRYFIRKLRPDTELPWVSFVGYQPPSVQEITLSFGVNCQYAGGSEVATVSQTIHFSYDVVMQYISYIASQRRIE